MTLRNALLGLVVLFGFSVWSACRPGGKAAHAQGADPVYTAEEAGDSSGGNHDEAARAIGRTKAPTGDRSPLARTATDPGPPDVFEVVLRGSRCTTSNGRRSGANRDS